MLAAALATLLPACPSQSSCSEHESKRAIQVFLFGEKKYLYLPFYYCFCQRKAPYYLVYFPKDESVCIVQAGAMIEEASCITEPGNTYVKEKKKIYKGIIVTYGKLHCDMKFSILYCIHKQVL